MRTFYPSGLASVLRWGAIVLLLLVPALTAWNLYAATHAPTLRITFGKPLRGVTARSEPLQWSLDALIGRELQKAVTDAVTEAIPARPLLIRLNNSFRKRLFGRYGAPGIVEGSDGHLVEQGYLTEYCSRDLAKLESRAAAWIPKLRALQGYYDARGRIFVYLITPSKVAHLPEKFVHTVPCAADPHDRTEYIPTYHRMLEAAGVRFVDAASLLHGLKGRYDLDLFPQGGVHWNMLGIAHAADAILAEVNRASAKPIAPRLKWTFEVTDRPTGIDTDLFDVVNLLFARPRYPTAKVDFGERGSCEQWPAAQKKIAIVGGSFLFGLGQTLINAGCLRRLEGYNYLVGGKYAGPDYREIVDRQSTADLLHLRETDIVILEENETVLPGGDHAEKLYELVLGK